MNNAIRKCVDNFGEAPREFSLWDRLTYFRVSKPAWLRSDPTDELTTHFKNLKSVFTNGTVTWGHIVQANVLMFEDGSHNCPGELVYSIENHNRFDPEYLQCVAGELFRLKGTLPDGRDDPCLRVTGTILRQPLDWLQDFDNILCAKASRDASIVLTIATRDRQSSRATYCNAPA